MNALAATAIVSISLLCSCTRDIEASPNDFSEAGFWKKRLDRDLPRRAHADEVLLYLQNNGAQEITFSADNRTLHAAQTIHVKQYFPPIDLNSVRIECNFDSAGQLQVCSAAMSTRRCCGK